MAELGVVYPEHEKKHKMLHNDSHKLESNFISVEDVYKRQVNIHTTQFLENYV